MSASWSADLACKCRAHDGKRATERVTLSLRYLYGLRASAEGFAADLKEMDELVAHAHDAGTRLDVLEADDPVESIMQYAGHTA